MTNKIHNVLYTGSTGNLIKRVYQHRHKTAGFTTKYNVHSLIYYEVFEDRYDAIKREKQIKAGSRKKKVDLINKLNPKWKDLYDNLF